MGPRNPFDDLKRTFVPPPELSGSRPRDVRLTGGGRVLVAVCVMLGLAAVGAGIGLFGTAMRQAANQRAFSTSGVVTTGEVVRLWRGSDEHKQPWMAYRYAVDGRTYDGRAKIKLAAWKALDGGMPVPVLYLRTDPARSRTAGGQTDLIPIWLPFVVGGALAAIGALCASLIAVQRRLLSEGRVAPAIVTAHKKTHTGHGGTQRSMTYTFPLLSGATAHGKSATSSKGPAIGGVICVLYDPERPRRNMPYPLQLVRPARR